MVAQVALTGILLNALRVGAHESRLVHSTAAVAAAYVAMVPFFSVRVGKKIDSPPPYCFLCLKSLHWCVQLFSGYAVGGE